MKRCVFGPALVATAVHLALAAASHSEECAAPAARSPQIDRDVPPASARAALPASAPATLSQVRRLILQGYYDRAEAALAARGESIETALARAAIDERLGRYREGIERLSAWAAAGESSADWHAQMAELLGAVGEYEKGVEHARAALRSAGSHARGRYLLGRLYETLGRTEDAKAAYRPFEDEMKRRLPDDAESLTYLGRGFLRYTTLTRHPEVKSRVRHVLQEVYQEAFDFVDADYWPARLAAAELLLEKHNLAEAAADLEHIRRINARVAEVEAGLARIALEKWDFDLVERRVRQALEINPRCVAAQCVLAECRMLERRYDDAQAAARAALAVNPRSLEALSLLAAALLRADDSAASEAVRQQVEKVNPACAVLPFTFGEWLSAARQYAEAEAAFKQAIERAPWWSEPRTELGMMYMQSGQEAEARQVLEASWGLDPFNQQTFHTLNLLDELEGYARHETAHFVIRYERESDAVLIPYLADHLESLHGPLCAAFEVALPRKTLIEVFPSHDRFSVRITGRPWIATVGACTGPVIALDAPRPEIVHTPFNWAEVLRHEFTHTVTLAATDNRIPHWFTEGLAVHQESAEKAWTTRELLSAAYRTDRLFDLRSIDWGFMRPRRADDRSLAYAQSEWMVEYIVERRGFPAVKQMLARFKVRQAQERVLREVLGVTPDAFIADFRAWAGEQIRSWGLPTDALGKRAALRAEALLRRKDAEVRARLAEATWYEEDFGEAEKFAREALELDAAQPLALAVLGRLLTEKGLELARGDQAEAAAQAIDEADRLLRRLERAKPGSAAAMKNLARIEQRWQEWEEAESRWMQYQKLCPADPESYRSLAAMALRQGRADEACKLLEQVWRLDDSDRHVPVQLAQMYGERGDAEAALAWWQRAIQVDAYDPVTYLSLGRAAERVGRTDAAERAYLSACALEPDAPDGYERLTALYQKNGNVAAAADNARKAEQRRGNPRIVEVNEERGQGF